MPPSSTDIDAALVALLSTDPALAGLMPGGVYFDAAPPGVSSFVILVLETEEDHASFPGTREYEDALYRIQAVTRELDRDTVNAAASRIDVLLENVELHVPAYRWMSTYREGRFRGTQADPVDPSIHWQVSGGNYRVQMAPVWGG